MSDVIRCIKYKDILKTNDVNIVRDYITPVDLWALIEHLIAIEEPVNDAFDLYSQKTVSKFDLLEHLHEKFGLKFKIIDNEGTKPGFSKNIYYTKNRKAESIGYVPKFSSIEGIINEINKMYECNLL